MKCGFNKTVPHATQYAYRDLLRGEFGEHFISRSGPVNWPPRSCDLTPLDYFLWGYVKAHVYTDKPASIDALEDNIEAFFLWDTGQNVDKSMPKFDKADGPFEA